MKKDQEKTEKDSKESTKVEHSGGGRIAPTPAKEVGNNNEQPESNE